MKSAIIINRVIVKSIVFVIGLTVGLFSANAFYKLIFSPVDRNEVRPLLENVKDYEPLDGEKLNPLRLVISANTDRELLLNSEETGKLDNFKLLTIRLKKIFEARKENGAFVEFSDRVVKEVIIAPNSTIKDVDLYNLVEALELSGANPILIDWNNEVAKTKLFICPRMINAKR
jgi:hypothetical protein